MAPSQYYEKVAGDETPDSADGGRKTTRVVRAPPTEKKKRPVLTIVALGAIAVTAFIAIVAIVSTAVVSYRLPAATEAALSKQSATPIASAVQPSASTEKSSSEMGDFGGMGSDDDSTIPSMNASAVFDDQHHKEMRNCGTTPDEARAAGCVFDVMMQLWTPPECMDAPLSERFLEKGNWTWYSDSNAEHSYSDEEIRKGDHAVVYVAQSYHRHHCIFAWERLVRAMRNQAPLIEELISYDHVMHCRHRTLTLSEEGAVRGVVAPTGFTRCASYDVWIKGLPSNKLSSIE